MRKTIGLLLPLIITMNALADPLSRERQREIIDAYLYVTGQLDEVPEALAAGAVMEDGHPIIKCGMSAVADFMMNRHRIDREILAGLSAALQPRPDDDLSATHDSPRSLFKIHYTTTGPNAVPLANANGNAIPDYVESTAIIFDSVYREIVEVLGYPKAPSDGFYPAGGDSLYDVYLLDLGSGVYGLTYLDSIYFDFPDSMQATSFMMLDRNYQELPQYRDRPLDAIRVTAAHEYFHAVQFAIDVTESDAYITQSDTLAARYWMEMSAVWMEEHMYDNINDFYYYLPYFYNSPRLSLQQFNSYSDLRPYANGIFPMFLDERYGTDMIRSIWFRCGEAGRGPDFLNVADPAIDSATDGAENWVGAVREFTLWNWFTGNRADLAPEGVGFPERENFPAFPDSTLMISWQYPDQVNANQNPLNPLHNGAGYIVLDSTAYVYPDTSYWICSGVQQSTCLGYPQEVLDPGSGYDFIRLGCGTDDTTYWACTSSIDSVCAQRRAVSVSQPWDFMIVRCDTIINGIDTTFNQVTRYYQCDQWVDSLCSDSVEVDSLADYDWMAIDTTLDMILALGTNTNVPPLPQPWGVSFIYRLAEHPDSIEIEQISLPDNNIWVLPFPNPHLYSQIVIALSPATHSQASTYYRPAPRYIAMDVSYQVSGEQIFPPPLPLVPPKPAVILASYPNPAVVERMGNQEIHFRFTVPFDSVGRPTTTEPELVIDLFTVAGERIRTITGGTIVGEDESEGRYEITWDMLTERGSEIASGAYVAVARLYDSRSRRTLLAEDKVKVAVIR